MKVGVIGAGAISEIYLKNMIGKFDALQVVGVAARHRENAEKRAAQFGIRAYTVEELLADGEIEMVVNLTPVGAHYDIIRRALLAGKHVYTEKTITDDPAKTRELLELAEEKGLYLGSAPDTFLGSALQAARAAIDGGALGEVHSFAISANRDNNILLSLFAFLREPGAGVLLDYGVYYVTALVSLLGPVARVGGIVGAPYRTHRNILPGPDFGKMMDTPNESQASAVLQLRSGVTGTLHMDNDSVMHDQAFFAIYGTKGILYLPDPNQFGGEVRLLPRETAPGRPAEPVVLWQFTPYGDNDRGLGPAEMAEAIAAGRRNRASKEMAAHVQEVLEAVLAGGSEGRFVDVRSSFERPEALKQKAVPVANIGHITFQMKDPEKMIRFYAETLGMQPLFTLTVSDLAATIRAQGGDAEYLRPVLEAEPEKPWIQYMKLSERQYLELFYELGGPLRGLGDRKDLYGFQKVNYEVESVEDMRGRLLAAGAVIKTDVHVTADGSRELAALDPDGNEIQFTEYGRNSVIPLAEAARGEGGSPCLRTTQVAFQVRDGVNMRNFYCRGLGLKLAFTLTCGALADGLERAGGADEAALSGLRARGDEPCIDYIEVAPRQYIEFFYCAGEEKRDAGKLGQYYGYQHICLETSDIHRAWDAVVANGLRPDKKIVLGCDGAYQFWLTDPDGNRLELMEYTPEAKHLL